MKRRFFANHDEESNQKSCWPHCWQLPWCAPWRSPRFAYNPGETKEDLNTKHDYGAFQIFEGVISKDNPTLSDVNWGRNITEPDIFLAKLKEDPTIGGKFETDFTAQDVLAVISKWHDSDDNSIAFARVVCHYLYPDANANPTPVATDHTGGINIPSQVII